MDNMYRIKSLKDKKEELKFDLTALQEDLKEKNNKIKEVESKLQSPYSVGVNLFMTILSIVITCTVVFFLLKLWIRTGFSVFVGFLLFSVAIISLIWDITAIITSTRKHHDKELSKRKIELENLLQKKQEMVANLHTLENEINEINNAIEDIKLFQLREEEEKKRRLEEEERERKVKLEERFQKIISSENIDRDELKDIADLGHDKAKIEMAKILIDDYYSKLYTEHEKKEFMYVAWTYLKGINTEKNVELEFLRLFCDSVRNSIFRYTLEDNLNRIREIYNAGVLCERYQVMANDIIVKIVDWIDEADLKYKERQRARDNENYNSNFSYSKSDSDNDSYYPLCAHYQNGCCKQGYNASYNISCSYSECFQNVCPNYQRR